MTFSAWLYAAWSFFIIDMHYRHPDPSWRCSFSNVVSCLSQLDSVLSKLTDEDHCCHTEAARLGAPLEAGTSLYPLLQNEYINWFHAYDCKISSTCKYTCSIVTLNASKQFATRPLFSVCFWYRIGINVNVDDVMHLAMDFAHHPKPHHPKPFSTCIVPKAWNDIWVKGPFSRLRNAYVTLAPPFLLVYSVNKLELFLANKLHYKLKIKGITSVLK